MQWGVWRETSECFKASEQKLPRPATDHVGRSQQCGERNLADYASILVKYLHDSRVSKAARHREVLENLLGLVHFVVDCAANAISTRSASSCMIWSRSHAATVARLRISGGLSAARTACAS